MTEAVVVLWLTQQLRAKPETKALRSEAAAAVDNRLDPRSKLWLAKNIPKVCPSSAPSPIQIHKESDGGHQARTETRQLGHLRLTFKAQTFSSHTKKTCTL